MVCRAIGTGSIPVPGVPVAYVVERTFDKRKKMVRIHPGLCTSGRTVNAAVLKTVFERNVGSNPTLCVVLSLVVEYHTFTVKTRVRSP